MKIDVAAKKVLSVFGFDAQLIAEGGVIVVSGGLTILFCFSRSLFRNLESTYISIPQKIVFVNSGMGDCAEILSCPRLRAKIVPVRTEQFVLRALEVLNSDHTEHVGGVSNCIGPCVFTKDLSNSLRNLKHQLDTFIEFGPGRRVMAKTATNDDISMVQSYLDDNLKKLQADGIACRFLKKNSFQSTIDELEFMLSIKNLSDQSSQQLFTQSFINLFRMLSEENSDNEESFRDK